jgi:hypothetical protein
VWLTAGPGPGHLAVVTETGAEISVTESAGHIWVALADRYGPPLALLEHCPAPEFGEGMETLDYLSRVTEVGLVHPRRRAIAGLGGAARDDDVFRAGRLPTVVGDRFEGERAWK